MRSITSFSSLVAAAAIASVVIAGCAAQEDPASAGAATSPVTEQEASPVEEPYEPVPWEPSTEIFDHMDAECGTDFAATAELMVEDAATLATAKYVGLVNKVRESAECALTFTSSPITWAAIESGIDFDSPETWIDNDGVWSGAGSITNDLLILEFHYLGSSS